MSYRDIVKQLAIKRAQSMNGIYARKMAEQAKERATREKFRELEKEAEIAEDMFESGEYEPASEKISTSKAREALRLLGSSVLKLLTQKNTKGRLEGTRGVIRRMADVVRDARITPKLQAEIGRLGGELIQFLNSDASEVTGDVERQSVREAIVEMTDTAGMDSLYNSRGKPATVPKVEVIKTRIAKEKDRQDKIKAMIERNKPKPKPKARARRQTPKRTGPAKRKAFNAWRDQRPPRPGLDFSSDDDDVGMDDTTMSEPPSGAAAAAASGPFSPIKTGSTRRDSARKSRKRAAAAAASPEESLWTNFTNVLRFQ